MRYLWCVATILSASFCLAQDQPPQPASGARELFYSGTAPKDTLPPPQAAKPPATPTRSTKAAPPAPSTGALNLGLRYTLLLVGKSGAGGQVTDPERNFRKGDCVAVNLESNRSGYLYVLAKESSGDWSPLFPEAGSQEENNRIDPGQVVRVPKHSCFEIEDPPGAENLFVVLSRNPRDIDELAESIKNPGGKTNLAVDHVAQQFGTRELSYRAVVNSEPANTPPTSTPTKTAPKKTPEHAVYVVSGSGKPASTLVTRVEIRHQ
jgi:hypothetical protein